MGDLDGDGLLDVVSGSESNDLTVYFNRGVEIPSTMDETSVLVFDESNHPFTVSDIDDDLLHVTLSVADGSLALGNTTDLIDIQNNGTGVVTFYGQQADIDNALDGLTYTPAERSTNYVATVTLQVDDQQGGVGSEFINITVSADDDVPVANADDFSILESDNGGVLNGNIHVDNGSGIDTGIDIDDTTLTAAGGIVLGAQFSMAFGGQLTLNSDDTFVYTVDDANPAAASTATVNITVTGTDAAAPIALDLNGDGHVNYVDLEDSQVGFDFDGDKEHIAWVDGEDGLLIYDKDNNGIASADEFILTNLAAGIDYNNDGQVTDLDGLLALDSVEFEGNRDGILNVDDKGFSLLQAWQDYNQDGVSDDGEVRSLAEVGITSFDLEQINTPEESSPVNGVTVVNTGEFTYVDGSTGQFDDMQFAVIDLEHNDSILIVDDDSPHSVDALTAEQIMQAQDVLDAADAITLLAGMAVETVLQSQDLVVEDDALTLTGAIEKVLENMGPEGAGKVLDKGVDDVVKEAKDVSLHEDNAKPFASKLGSDLLNPWDTEPTE